MLKQFKKMAFKDPITPEQLQAFQDNIEIVFQELNGFPAIAKEIGDTRIERPGYSSDTDGIITIAASSDDPKFFFIDSKLHKVTADLVCNLSVNGVGGLESGTLAANTPYYLYAVLSDNKVFSIASIEPPANGPVDYQKRTYVGAFATDNGSAIIRGFRAINGNYFSDDELSSDSLTGTTTITKQVVSNMPVTAKAAWMQLQLTGGSIGNNARVNSLNIDINNSLIADSTGDSQADLNLGWVSILTSKTVWFKLANSGNTMTVSLFGWKENPMEYI